jgi:mono/diheme cytochrome c family protein
MWLGFPPPLTKDQLEAPELLYKLTPMFRSPSRPGVRPCGTRLSGRRGRYCAMLAIAIVVVDPATGHAADAARGAQLAQTWCANCHIVGSGSQRQVQVGPPSFHEISSLSSDRLRTFLVKRHPPMPDMSLSRSEMDDLIAYIKSLK